MVSTETTTMPERERICLSRNTFSSCLFFSIKPSPDRLLYAEISSSFLKSEQWLYFENRRFDFDNSLSFFGVSLARSVTKLLICDILLFMKKNAEQIVKKTTHDYNLIAEDFSSKRDHLSKDILYFKDYIENGDKVLDFGCGNGRLIDLFSGMNIEEYLGLDVSKKLIEIAKKKYPKNKFKLTDKIPLSCASESFSKVFSLAVFHHIPTKELRSQYLSELRRVLVKDGLLVLTVWSIPAEKLSGYEKVDTGENDVLVPFRDSFGKKLADRFFHIYGKEELEDFFTSCGLHIIESKYLPRGNRGYGNWCVIAKK